MRKKAILRGSALLLAVASGSLSGCATYEVNTGRGNIPGYWIRSEMQEADRAVEQARAAGKDQACPDEFKKAEEAKNNAYDVFRACHTEEGAALARQATAQANALCPPRAVKVVPPTRDTLTAAPASITRGETVTLTWNSENAANCDIQPGVGPVPTRGSMTVTPADNVVYLLTCSGAGGSAQSSAMVAVAAPAPLAPSGRLTASPSIITRGESATLQWSSQNAGNCDIAPFIGPVPPQGSMPVTPGDTTAYILTCGGAGGSATSTATVTVTVPPPPVAAAPPIVAAVPKASAQKLCQPTVINVHFDTNKADIKPQYHSELKNLADFLIEFPKATGSIAGHTDSVGDKAANMKLSQRRAESVRSYLIEKFGISGDRIKAVGYGPTKPIADNRTAAGKEQNRRIESNFSCD